MSLEAVKKDIKPVKFAIEITGKPNSCSTACTADLSPISVAVPVRGYGGKVVAALGVVIPANQKDGSHLVPALKVTADGLSKKMVAAGVANRAAINH